MDIKEVCVEALNYSGEKYISHIVKTDERYIISLCDRMGHELFMAPVAIDLKNGDVYDYSPLDDINENEQEIIDIPPEYISIKAIIISILLKNRKLDNTNSNILDTLYEKYDLYNIKPYTAYAILNYYTSILVDFKETAIRNDAYQFIIADDRSVDEIIEDSKSFGFELPEINALNVFFEKIMYCSIDKYYGVDINETDELVREAYRLFSVAEETVNKFELFKEELSLQVNELKNKITAEYDYISGKASNPTDLLKQKIELADKCDLGYGDNRFSKLGTFTNHRFEPEG